MKSIRTLTAYALTALILVIVAASAGCGASATATRQSAIMTGVATIHSSAPLWHAWDLQHQRDLEAQDKGDQKKFDADKAAYRSGTQKKVNDAIAGALRAAEIAITLNTDQSLSAFTQAALVVANELHALGIL